MKDDCFVSDQKSLLSSRKRNASPLVKWEEVSQTTSAIITQPPGRHNKLTLLHIDNSDITLNAGGLCVKNICFVSDKKSMISPRKRKTSPQVKEQEEVKQTFSVTFQTPGKMLCAGKLWILSYFCSYR